MSGTPLQRKTSFVWQGVLILLPVAVLAIVSIISLRQDERAAEEDARNRAAENVQSLGRAIRDGVDGELQRFLTIQNMWMLGLHSESQASVSSVFPDPKVESEINKWEHDYPRFKLAEFVLPQGIILSDGRQIEPPDYPDAPVPPKWFRELTTDQRVLWESLRAADSGDVANRRLQAFSDSHPSSEAERAAELLRWHPLHIAQNSGATPSESGISYEDIACYRLLSETNAQLTDALLQSVWQRAIDHPSILSPRLLDLTETLTNRAAPVLQQKVFWMRKYFDKQTRTREQLHSLRQLSDLQPWKKLWWSHWTPDGSALAIFQPTRYVNPGNDGEGVSLSGEGYNVSLVPEDVLVTCFIRAAEENKSLIPPYASAQITIEGVRMSPLGPGPRSEEKMLLGKVEQQAGKSFAQNAIRFEVAYYLTSREQMLAAEHRRAKLFGALILGAALTALVGLLSARLSFRRQQELNELKTNFVSSVSHELRAPIASVRLMAENLEGNKIPEPGKQKEYFRFIGQECRRLSALIENVLDFSRIEQGRKQYEFEPTDLVALTQTTVRLMEPYAAEKGVNLELNPAPGQSLAAKFELEVDGRAIQQALVNLVDNAIKHSAKGQTVTLEIEAGSQSSFNLSVSDRGAGIPKAEQEKIFERFYRLGSELRRETQGIGIGLSIVKHIVEAHGGHVTVKSGSGQGSRFTINLPAK